MSHAINDWLGLTEICFGLVVTKRVDITKFHSTMFQEPYDEGFEEFARHGDVTKTSQSITPAMYNAAIAAAGTIEDGTGIEWHKSLNKASKGFAIGTKAQRLGKAMASGKEVQTADIMEFTSALRDFASPDAIGLHALSEVDDNYEPFIKCGWAAIDDNVGGIPASRPLVVGGDTGLGKTFMQMRLTGAFLTEHPDALGAIYTLEMSDRAWRKRFVTMFPEYEDVMERIYISKSAVSVPEIGIEVASIGAGFVGVDYMDYLIRGEISEAAWRRTNLQLNEICRTLEIPLCILHQFNANRYTDPVPQMKHFAWGTSSTNVAGMVITLAKFRNAEDVGDYIAFDDDRPMTMLFWKSGDGWVGKRGPLAVSLPLVKNLWADEAGRCQTIGDEIIVKKFRKGGKNE